MRKRISFRLISVFLCVIMLFTSENMSYSAYAAPAAGEEDAVTINIEDSENDDSESNISPEEESALIEIPAENAETENAETPEMQEESPDMEKEAELTTDPSEETVAPPDGMEEPPVSSDGEDSQETHPDDSKAPESETSVSANTMSLITPKPEVTDFVIVDEGGKILDLSRPFYLDRNQPRNLSVRPTPQYAFYDEVIWSSDNPLVSVTDGNIAVAPEAEDSSENNSSSAAITVRIGEIIKTCKVEILPLPEDVIIVDQNGNAVPESGIIIEPGEEIKLGVKLVPESIMMDSDITWQTNANTIYIDSLEGILGVSYTLSSFPYECSVTAHVVINNNGIDYTFDKTCKVTVVEPDARKLVCGDLEFFCPGMGTPEKVSDTVWKASIDKDNTYSFSCSYIGSESTYRIYYTNNSTGLEIISGHIFGNKYYDWAKIQIDPDYPLQIAVATGSPIDYKDYKISDIYTFHFTPCQTDFALSTTTINTVPGGYDQELQIKQLPDGCQAEDVTWSSSDEKLVSISGKTKKGAMLRFGHGIGTAEITAAVKDHTGQNVYAICHVNIRMTLPPPEFSSESGGRLWRHVSGNYGYYYWLVDKGGKITLSVKNAPEAQIYYTTDGRDPIKYGKRYQEPIPVNSEFMIKACTKLEDYGDSDVSEVISGRFYIGNPKFSLSRDTVYMEQASSRKITVTLPTDAEPGSVMWESSNSSVADADTVPIKNNSGDTIGYEYVITSETDSGSCTLTASIIDYAGREQTATCRVTVAGELEIPHAITVMEGDSAVIHVTKMPDGIPKNEISWFSSDYSIADVEPDQNGDAIVSTELLADTSEPQTVIIQAMAEEGKLNFISAYCEVTVKPRQYTVRFFGRNNKLIKTETLGRGQDATPPEDAVMRAAAPKGYLFDGWQNSNDCENVTKDIDIYAKPYVLQPYRITYITGSEGSGASANPVTYTVAEKNLSLQDAIPTDSKAHKFAGWYLEKDYSGSPIDEISTGSTGNITLYAKWISAKGLHIEPIVGQAYTGKAVKPAVKVYDGDTLLTLGTDYTISYKNNTKACMMPWADPKKVPTVTIKGKGNYSGSDTETFQILPQSIAAAEKEVVIPDLYMNCSGKSTPDTPTATWNGKKLRYHTDFEITQMTKDDVVMTSCAEEGVYAITIAGKGNFSGTRNISLTVTRKTLLSKVSFKPGKLKDIPWSDLQGKTLGEAKIDVDAGVVLQKDGMALKKGTDYTVTFDTDVKEVGTYSATFTGTGTQYAGTVTKTFQITGKPISASRLDIQGLRKLTYTGDKLTQLLTISYKDGNTQIPMILGTDYTLDYDNTTNVGKKASVIITGINGYTGTVKKTFEITPYSLEEGYQSAEKTVKVSLADKKVYYEKGGAKPKIVVTYQNSLLTEGTDYTVTYKNNNKIPRIEDAKPPTFTVKGKGNFKDSVSLTFSILPQDIGKLTVTAEDVMAAAPKNGEKAGMTGKGKYKSTPKITDFNGKVLSAGTDFKKTYTFTDENGMVLSPNDQVPENSVLTVSVEGLNNYTGETRVSYRVLPANMSLKKASVSLKNGVIKTYDMESVVLKKEDLIVKLNGRELSKDQYAIVSYVDNRKKGTAKVTIQGVGVYGGQKTVSFKINPRTIAWFKTP